MKLYKINQIYFIYNIVSKKIYIEESRKNNVLKINTYKILQNFSIDDLVNCRWKIYRDECFQLDGEIKFQKLLKERFE